jgi:hypothetical protein
MRVRCSFVASVTGGDTDKERKGGMARIEEKSKRKGERKKGSATLRDIAGEPPIAALEFPLAAKMS